MVFFTVEHKLLAVGSTDGSTDGSTYGSNDLIYNNLKYSGETKKFKISNLSQKEIADGWQQVLPRRLNNKQQVIKLNIPLYQLPVHLWHRVGTNIINNRFVLDTVFSYYIKPDNTEEHCFKLKKEVESKYPNKEVLEDLLSKFEPNTNSWLLIRAHSILKN
jgi:hypothetical protein